MKFDDILLKVGEFGRYQWQVYTVICLFQLITPLQMFSMVFMTDDSHHWCKIAEWKSVNCTAWGFNSSLECQESKKQVGIPSKYVDNISVEYEHCKQYDVTDVEFDPSLNLTGYDTVPCDAGWEFDTNHNSLIRDFNLVCGKEKLLSLSLSLFFLGDSVGIFLLGMASDRYGRHPSLFLCLAGTIIIGVIIAFSTSFWMYTVLRMVVAGLNSAVITIAYVLGNEFIGPSKRFIAGNVIWTLFAMGFSLLALMAYLMRNWRHLQLAISVSPVILLASYFFLPESPRWLMAQKENVKAEKIITKLAKVNKSTLPPSLFDEDKTEEEKEQEKTHSFLEVLRRPRLRWYTIILTYQLIVNVLVYYGLSLSVDTLGVNIYVAFAISGAVEIPAYVVASYPTEYFGRRPCYFFFMICSGTACLATIFIPPGIVKASIAMIGKFAITASFGTVYLQVVEIYPTPVRNSAVGVTSLLSRITSILCPFILLLADIWEPLPLVVFSCLSVVGASICFFLPETRGRQAPETIEDSENLGRKKRSSQKKSKKLHNGTDVKYHKAAYYDEGVHL